MTTYKTKKLSSVGQYYEDSLNRMKDDLEENAPGITKNKSQKMRDAIEKIYWDMRRHAGNALELAKSHPGYSIPAAALAGAGAMYGGEKAYKHLENKKGSTFIEPEKQASYMFEQGMYDSFKEASIGDAGIIAAGVATGLANLGLLGLAGYGGYKLVTRKKNQPSKGTPALPKTEKQAKEGLVNRIKQHLKGIAAASALAGGAGVGGYALGKRKSEREIDAAINEVLSEIG